MAISLQASSGTLGTPRLSRARSRRLGETVGRLNAEFLGGALVGSAPSEAQASERRGPIQRISLLQRSLSDGISFTQTASDGLDRLRRHLESMVALALSSQGAEEAGLDRGELNRTYQARRGALRRLVEQTGFAGKKMLLHDEAGMTFQVGSEAGQTLSVPGTRIDLSHLGETDWCAFPGEPMGLPFKATPGAGQKPLVEIHDVPVDFHGVATPEEAAWAVNQAASETGVCAILQPGPRLVLWRREGYDQNAFPLAAAAKELLEALGFGRPPRSLSHRITLEDTEISSWGAAEQARQTLLDALSKIERFRNRYEFLAARFAAVVEFADVQAAQAPERSGRLADQTQATQTAAEARIHVLRNPERAREVQAHSEPALVLNLLGAA